MYLDKELKDLRKRKGITQEHLASKLYVSIQTINKWENGKCLPDAINLLNIAQFYEISLDVLMRNEILQKVKAKKKERKFNLRIFFNNFRFLKNKKT